jgi:tetratricopeptide (TPR) repeat protein/DNA-binding winged helix-turn-helix (wHTH) protein
MHGPKVLRLDDSLEVDLAAYRVRRGAEAIHLRQQTAQVLSYLIEHSTRVVPKDELVSRVWGDVAVSDSALAQCIKEIRQAFDDDPKASRFIRTVPRVGYQFVGIARAGAPDDIPRTPPPVDIEVIERTGARPSHRWTRRALGFVAMTAVCAGAAVYITWRAPAVPPVSAGSGETMTSSLEAFRAYSEGLKKADGYQLPEALVLFRRALALDPGFTMAEARIGYAYVIQGDWPAADGLPYLERAFRASNRLGEADRASIFAWYALAKGDYTTAIDAYRRLLAIQPRNSEAYWRLGRLLVGEERYGEGIDVLLKGIDIDPYQPALYNSLATLYTAVGRHDDAATAAARYAELLPREPNAWDSLGLAHQAAGRLDKAVAAYNRAIEVAPDFKLALIHRGNLRFQHGQFKAAMEDFSTFIANADSDGQRARGHFARAWVLLARGDVARAQAEALTSVRLAPGTAQNPQFWEVRAAAGVRVPTDVQPQAANGRAQQSFLRTLYGQQGEWAALLNRPQEALTAFREAVRHRPITWAIETYDDSIARLFFQQRDWRAAEREYRAVIAAHPSFGRARFELAQTYDALGDRASAETQYRKFLELWSAADADAPQIRHARQRLGLASIPF